LEGFTALEFARIVFIQYVPRYKMYQDCWAHNGGGVLHLFAKRLCCSFVTQQTVIKCTVHVDEINQCRCIFSGERNIVQRV